MKSTPLTDLIDRSKDLRRRQSKVRETREAIGEVTLAVLLATEGRLDTQDLYNAVCKRLEPKPVNMRLFFDAISVLAAADQIAIAEVKDPNRATITYYRAITPQEDEAA